MNNKSRGINGAVNFLRDLERTLNASLNMRGEDRRLRVDTACRGRLHFVEGDIIESYPLRFCGFGIPLRKKSPVGVYRILTELSEEGEEAILEIYLGREGKDPIIESSAKHLWRVESESYEGVGCVKILYLESRAGNGC